MSSHDFNTCLIEDAPFSLGYTPIRNAPPPVRQARTWPLTFACCLVLLLLALYAVVNLAKFEAAAALLAPHARSYWRRLCAFPFEATFERCRAVTTTRSVQALLLICVAVLLAYSVTTLVRSVVVSVVNSVAGRPVTWIVAGLLLLAVAYGYFVVARTIKSWHARNWARLDRWRKMRFITLAAGTIAVGAVLFFTTRYTLTLYAGKDDGCYICIGEAHQEWCWFWCASLAHMILIASIVAITSTLFVRTEHTPFSLAVTITVVLILATGVELQNSKLCASALTKWAWLFLGVLVCIVVFSTFAHVVRERSFWKNRLMAELAPRENFESAYWSEQNQAIDMEWAKHMRRIARRRKEEAKARKQAAANKVKRDEDRSRAPRAAAED